MGEEKNQRQIKFNRKHCWHLLGLCAGHSAEGLSHIISFSAQRCLAKGLWNVGSCDPHV